MADLNPAQLKKVFRAIVSEYAQEKPVDITKNDFKDAAQALSNWVDANMGSANSALPTAFKTNASVPLKAALLSAVTLEKFKG